jgi:hypothetical protein
MAIIIFSVGYKSWNSSLCRLHVILLHNLSHV